ncbi:MAG: Gfo/Idh/MocA family oxidoreductase [Lentimicrobiaceae bacterium]|nr:Gfo/Idh/MocA family oxidoreductase [Lentimicrobiaceae bacterium]
MKKRHFLGILVVFMAAIFFSCSNSNNTESKNYIIQDNTIVFPEPERIEGQKSVLQFSVEPIPVVRMGFIGLGMRGADAVNRISNIEGVEFKALCDLVPERVTSVQENVIKAKNLPECAEYSGEEGWKELCERDDIDLVYICTDWVNHVPMAVYAMQQGKHVALEVPAATSVAECWQLVDVAEQTQRHCMMLENCCYDFFELTCLNMAQQGLFGEVIHAQGAYIHNLEPFWAHYQGNWRLEFNQKHAGDVYATHGLGPVCQVMDIHRGDKMDYLVSLSTPSINGLKIAKETMGSETFANGDMTSTLIKTNRGKTILIQHNVYTPRPYDRLYQLTGTEGFANKYPIQGFTLKEENIPSDVIPDHEDLDSHGFVPSDIRDSLLVAYKHPIAKDIEEKAKQVGGHGGMDFIMDYRLIYCLQNGLPLDQDVYDAAEWSCLGELTAASIENNGLRVKFPDFTRGDWNKVKGYKHAVK